MNALPMLETCFTRQWAGLGPAERARLAVAWDQEELPSATTLKGYETAHQSERPVWTVAFGDGVGSLCLIGVKVDHVEAEP
jgi:hypothetical protein